MTPDGAVRLLDLYGRAGEALDGDDLEAADRMLGEADLLIAEPAGDADRDVVRVLALQVEAARRASETALARARERLLKSAQSELRQSGDAARGYADASAVPARFIDRKS